MNCRGNAVSEFVEWCKNTKKLCEGRANYNGEHGIPDEESDNGSFGNVTLLPGNLRVSNEGDDDCDCGGDEIGEPKKIIIFNNEISDDSVENVVESCNADADEKISSGVSRSFDVGFGCF